MLRHVTFFRHLHGVTHGRLSNTRTAHLSLFVGRLRKHAPASKSTPTQQLDSKEGKQDLWEGKRDRKCLTWWRVAEWCYIQTYKWIMRKEWWCFCQCETFLGEYFLIGKRNDVTEKRRESSWKFCFICQIFQKEEIIHLLFYLLPTFKIIVFYFSSTWSPNWNAEKFNRTFSEWQSITRQISNTKCIPHLGTYDDSSYQLCCSHISQ